VFLLRHVDGASYAHIADVLGLPEGTIAWILHRARRSLRSSLRDLVEGER
jgi:DNA-directed RNA polymerase specialized sigma24 family protein